MKTAAVLGILAILVLLLLAVIYWRQDRMLYFPARAGVAELTASGLQPWPSAEDFRGLVAAPAGPVRGTVVVLHGNTGHAGHRAFYAEALVPLGWRVLLAEYPGYGPRPGDPSEASLVDDAVDTIALAHRAFGAPVVLLGESLGAGVAAGAAARRRDVLAGLMLVTPWDRLAHVGAHHYPWLPVHWMLRDHYDSRSRLAAFDRPVLVLVAVDDVVVPARLGSALHAGLPGPKRLLVIENAGHSDWMARVDAGLWRLSLAFLLGEPMP